MTPSKFLCDVDGVVADLIGGFGSFLDREFHIELPYERIVFHNDMGRSPGLTELDSLLRLRWPEPGADGGLGGAFATYMKDRDVYSRWVLPVPGAVDAISRIRGSYDVIFVTALMRSARDHFRSKMEWVERFFPGLPIITCPSSLKWLVSDPGAIAVDDRYDTCMNWVSVGVRTFLFRQPWNEAPAGEQTFSWNRITELLDV